MRIPVSVLRVLPLALVLLLAPLAYIQPRASAQPADRLPVVTSSTVFVDMIQRVGGDYVEAFSLVPAGADPHTYQPTPNDLQRATRARVAVWNGLGLDETTENVVDTLGLDLVEVTLTEGIEPIAGEVHAGEDEVQASQGHDDEEGNPHMWLDPTLAMRYVERIRDALTEADATNAATYQANAAQYMAEIAELDAYALRELAAIPLERRKLVTFHDAFPYLARHYNFEVVGVVLQSPGREPSAQEVATLVNQIREQQVPTVYTEPQFNARILELAARDAGVGVRALYSDALDDSVRSYLDLMRYNVTSLVEGLR